VLVVEGRAGIGKTALAEEAARRRVSLGTRSCGPAGRPACRRRPLQLRDRL
jgi:MoxR-like ATPase